MVKKAEVIRSSVRRELGLLRPARAPLRVLAFAGLLWSVEAAAQPPYRQEILPGVSSLVSPGGARQRLVDLDGDGDSDLAVGRQDGTLTYFESVPGEKGPTFVGVAGSADPFAGIDVGSVCDPDFADLDGDGDFDLVASDGSSRLRYFENTGSSSAPAFAARTGSANPFGGIAGPGAVRGPALGDLDGDGDLDLVVGENPGRYFRNIGNASAPAFLELTGAASPFGKENLPGSPALGDVDGDGDLDIAASLFNGVAYLRNFGTSSAPAFHALNGDPNPFGAFTGSTFKPELADLDGDGDIDALLFDTLGVFDTIYNTGSAGNPAFMAAGATDPVKGLDLGGRELRADFVDLDGDGDLDMVAANPNRLVRLFLNTGSAARPAFVEQTGSADPFSLVGELWNDPVVDFADLDGDGDLDALAGSGPELGGLFFLRNVGSSNAPFFQRGSTDNVFGTPAGWMYMRASPELGDMDGDGDFDVVMGVTNNVLKYYENTGTSGAPLLVERGGSEIPFGDVFIPHAMFPEAVDFDQDGDLDVLYNGVGNVMEVLENTGAGFVRRSGSANPLIEVDSGVGAMMDIDGDGDFDFLLGADGGRLVFFRSSAVFFYDGFESGDTSGWSNSTD